MLKHGQRVAALAVRSSPGAGGRQRAKGTHRLHDGVASEQRVPWGEHTGKCLPTFLPILVNLDHAYSLTHFIHFCKHVNFDSESIPSV